MYFIDDVRGFTDFLVKHKLTPNQFYYLMLRQMCFVDADNAVRATLDYINASKGFTKKELQDLEDRGYLENHNEPGKYNVKYYLATEKFYDEIFADTNFAGEELWNAYPNDLIIDGKKCSAKTGDKEDLIKLYVTKKIKYNKNAHKKVLEALEKQKLEGITMGIEKWIRSEQWKNVKQDVTKPGYGEKFIK